MLHTQYSTETSETRTYTNSDGTQTTSYSSSHSDSSNTLEVTVVSASNLVSVQTLGKQDPYLRFSLDHTDKESFKKTATAENAGENASWNQNFKINYNAQNDLFVEVLNKESTFDNVIGFAAIPLNQVQHASGSNLNGLFDIYNTKKEKAGVINLQLAFPNSQRTNFEQEPIKGSSYVNEEHSERIKSSKKKAVGAGVGGALLGGALAVGAGFLGKKVYDDHKEKNEEAERQQQEKQRLDEEEDQKRKQEREEFEQEKARFEQEKRDNEERNKNRNDEHDSEKKHGSCNDNKKKNQGDCDDDNKKRHGRRNSNSSDEDEDAKKWNPVGTYAPGDRVKYHGQVYMCLQGHTSNPTWQPGVAHSLWQAE